MKRYLLFLSVVSSFLFWQKQTIAQTPGQWTWMHGDSAQSSPGKFGTKGVTNANDFPPSFYAVAAWTDLQGNFWIYGGVDYTISQAYGDLWKYDVIANTWTWMTGPGNPGVGGVYGTKGVASPANTPGTRSWGMCTWTDNNNNLWMFGGFSDFYGGALNDLWKYDISTNQWTWMSGKNGINGAGVYGTQGVPSASNVPPTSDENVSSWVDNAGNLWMFGGEGSSGGLQDDVWKYDVITNQWTWMNGSATANTPAAYGTRGVPSSANHPGGRYTYTHWKDKTGNFWMFGGTGNAGALNDLWKYDLATNLWTWMNGSNLPTDQGSYQSYCDTVLNNYPSNRTEHRACWTDACGNFWLYGGDAWTTTFSAGAVGDLWQYNPAQDKWKWINGTQVLGSFPVYGSKGISSSTNFPGGRCGALGGIDKKGNLWLFGGFYQDTLSNYWTLGDLWRFVPDVTCGGCALSGLPPVAHFTSSDTVFCNESGSCIDFFDHSTNTPTSWKWTFSGAQPDSSTQQNPTNICYYIPGTYAVSLVVSNSSGSDSITVPSMIVFKNAAAQPFVIHSNDTLFSSHASSYQWYFNGSPIPSATDSFLVITGDGIYAVNITDQDGCSRLSNGFPVLVPAIEAMGGWKVYPNPAGDQLTIDNEQLTMGNTVVLRINDVLGEMVMQSAIRNQKSEIDVHALAKGMYVIEISKNEKVFRARFLKQ